MVSATFIGKLTLLPWQVLKTTIEYYTVGTVYSTTNEEFKDSLRKNIIIAIESYLATSMTKGDIETFTYVDTKKLLYLLSKKKIVTDGNLNNFGVPYDGNSYWLVNNEQKGGPKNVLVYFHGGGYAVGIMECQILGLLILYHCLPRAVQKRLSILIVDYPLTIHGQTYPSQIHDAVIKYRKLTLDGFDNIYLMGDSAGANLVLALSRYVAYPEEARKEFSKYEKFDFPYIKGSQPKGLILISPWVEPRMNTSVDITCSTQWYGDLIGCKTDMDKWYIADTGEFVNGWITFADTTYQDHWCKIDCFREKEKVLVIAGERELLRNSIEQWMDVVDKNRENCIYALEKGGIHDCIFNVETLDYTGLRGNRRALKGDFSRKFCISHVVEYLVKNITA